MAFAKFFAAIMGLLYVFFFVQSVTASSRTGWFYRSVGSGNSLLYHLTTGHDLVVGLIFLWLAVFQTSNLLGRSVMLWLAHLSLSAVFLGKFENTSDEGELQRWGCIGKPICLILGCYWYYLVFSGQVSLVDIWDTIEAFLDD